MDRPPDFAALAALRPGDSREKLVAAVGERWVEPYPALGGRVETLMQEVGFSARLDREGRIGELQFKSWFDPGVAVVGVSVGMPQDALREVARAVDTKAGELEWLGMGEQLRDRSFGTTSFPVKGGTMRVWVGYGNVSNMSLTAREPRWPEPGPFLLPRPTQAFHATLGEVVRRRNMPAPDGWAYGLPRGIAPEQWPLSWNDAMPLQHFFTVRVPEPYRTQGPDRVALAFFGENAGEAVEDYDIREVAGCLFDGRSFPDVGDEMRPLVERLRVQHPHVHHMRDALGTAFAAIWLSEAEFAGTECEPPEPLAISGSTPDNLPDWLREGPLAAMISSRQLDPPADGRAVEQWDIIPFEIEEVEDVNVGKVPWSEFGEEPNPDGYLAPYTGEWDALELEELFPALSFGGTAYPSQWLPPLTPFHVGVQESAGGINLGTGNGQLDLVTMRFDWAC